MLHDMARGKIFSSKVGELFKQEAAYRRGTGTCLPLLLDILSAATMLEQF
jgi:hypothetical protein